MLRVRLEQFDALRVCLNPDYEDEAVLRLRELFPEFDAYEDEAFREHLRYAAPKAAAYGIHEGRNLLLFAAFMVFYGHDFDQAFPAVQTLLQAPGQSEDERIDALYRFADYFEQLLRDNPPAVGADS